MHASIENMTVAVLNESLRLLQMCSRKVSVAKMREICTAGPEGTLLKTCLAYVTGEWPGETQAAGVFREFHALPTTELAAVRKRVIECCRGFSTSSIRWEPEDYDEGPMGKFNGMS